MAKRRALLVGATGLVGGHLLARLLADDDYARVVVLARRALEVAHPKLDARVVDFAALPLADAPRVDDVFSALGTTIKKAGSQEAFRSVDHGAVLAVARAALAAGAERFLLVSSIGADPASRVFYSRVKGETERDVRALGYPSLHVFRPSILLGARRETRRGERAGIAVARALSPVLAGPLAKYRPTDAAALAAAMVNVAKRGERGERVHLSHDVPALAA